MCKYCSDDNNQQPLEFDPQLIENLYHTADIVGNRLWIEVDHDSVEDLAIIINFCPMCGRAL